MVSKIRTQCTTLCTIFNDVRDILRPALPGQSAQHWSMKLHWPSGKAGKDAPPHHPFLHCISPNPNLELSNHARISLTILERGAMKVAGTLQHWIDTSGGATDTWRPQLAISCGFAHAPRLDVQITNGRDLVHSYTLASPSDLAGRMEVLIGAMRLVDPPLAGRTWSWSQEHRTFQAADAAQAYVLGSAIYDPTAYRHIRARGGARHQIREVLQGPALHADILALLSGRKPRKGT